MSLRKTNSKLDMAILKKWRNFNRLGPFKYQSNDGWKWELSPAEKIMYDVIQTKFEEKLKNKE